MELKISTLNSRTFRTFLGSVRTLMYVKTTLSSGCGRCNNADSTKNREY